MSLLEEARRMKKTVSIALLGLLAITTAEAQQAAAPQQRPEQRRVVEVVVSGHRLVPALAVEHDDHRLDFGRHAAVGRPQGRLRRHALCSEPDELDGADGLEVGEPELRAVLDRRPGRDVVPDTPLVETETAPEPRVESLLGEREIHGLIDVTVGVEITPADVDALLVQVGP